MPGKIVFKNIKIIAANLYVFWSLLKFNLKPYSKSNAEIRQNFLLNYGGYKTRYKLAAV